MKLLFQLLIGHAIADFALQSDTMAKGKNRHNVTEPPPGQKYVPCWPYWLLAHGLIHAGAVLIITNNYLYAVTELITHVWLDFGKCENITNPHQDQFCHIVTKLFYLI